MIFVSDMPQDMNSILLMEPEVMIYFDNITIDKLRILGYPTANLFLNGEVVGHMRLDRFEKEVMEGLMIPRRRPSCLEK